MSGFDHAGPALRADSCDDVNRERGKLNILLLAFRRCTVGSGCTTSSRVNTGNVRDKGEETFRNDGPGVQGRA